MYNRITMRHVKGNVKGVVRISVNGKPIFTVGKGWLFVSVVSVLEELTYTASEIARATDVANKYILNAWRKF